MLSSGCPLVNLLHSVPEALDLGLSPWTPAAFFSPRPALHGSFSDPSSEQRGYIKALKQILDPSMLTQACAL